MRAITRMKSSITARCWRGRSSLSMSLRPRTRSNNVQPSSSLRPYTSGTGTDVRPRASMIFVSLSNDVAESSPIGSRSRRRKPSSTEPSGRVTSTTHASRRATWRSRRVIDAAADLGDPLGHARGQVVRQVGHRAPRFDPAGGRYRALVQASAARWPSSAGRATGPTSTAPPERQ